MKKILSLALGVIAIFALLSCSRKMHQQKSVDLKPIPVILSLVQTKNLANTEIGSIQLYNTDEIRLSTQRPIKRTRLENGVFLSVDSTELITLIIPQGTKGTIIEVDRTKKGSPDSLLVSFDTNNKVFQLWFYLEPNAGGYRLQGWNGKTIHRLNVEYQLYSVQPPDRCRLYFYDGSLTGAQITNINAGGHPIGGGQNPQLIGLPKEKD